MGMERRGKDGGDGGGGAADQFSPFDGMDSDNINFAHSVNYDEVRALIDDLPPGWRRLDAAEVEPGRPPYVHEPSGETSWKNPNLAKVMHLADEHRERQKRENEGGDGEGSSKQVKKLRLMLQAGAPLGAVEQKARLEGVDMSLVLSPSDGKEEKAAMVSDSEDEGRGVAIPETLVKKYRRMIKGGVPIDRVQQLAGVETGAPPEQIARLLKEQGGNDNEEKEEAEEEEKSNDRAVNTRMNKFVRTKKAGVPLVTIQNAAQLQGHDLKELTGVLGVDAQDYAKDCKVNEGRREVKATVADETSAAGQYFTLQKDAVAFPSSRGVSPLADLVRQLAQTVQKTGRFSTGSTSEMVVDELTLYHALGALKGVHFARNEYNSSLVNEMDREIHSKRHAFLEMAKSIGMALPEGRVDIDGLDDLIHHVEASNGDKLELGRSLLKDGYYEFDSLHSLYPPGSYVIAKHAGGSGVDSVCQVNWHRYTQGRTISGKPMKYFQLSLRFIIPVGGGLSTFAEVVEGIEMFEGRRSLSASASGAGLAFVPLTGQELQPLLRRYQRRGELYNRVTCIGGDRTHCFMEYEKGCFFQKSGGGSFHAGKSSVALASSGRIVLDFDAASDNGHSISMGRDDMVDGITMKRKEFKLHLRSLSESKGSGANATLDVNVAGDLVLFSHVPDEHLALVWPTTVGFSLTSKSWGDVVIDGLGEIDFDPDVFDRLVLPNSRKRMIKALTKHTSGFHDLVEGKGEGTVFLLYGLPGTGKTLTAEASLSRFTARSTA